jgi:hypothetical protein
MSENEMPVERSMKPMLAECIHQAVHLALIDAAIPEAGLWTDEQRAAMELDIHAIPSEAVARMDLRALAQNVVIRLLGPGGWLLPTPDGPIYTGNATTSEVFEATSRPGRRCRACLRYGPEADRRRHVRDPRS